jgi:hypothetical protein
MNVKTLATLALAAASIGSAFAETPNVFWGDNFVSTKSRTEVQAELAAYKQGRRQPLVDPVQPAAPVQEHGHPR